MPHELYIRAVRGFHVWSPLKEVRAVLLPMAIRGPDTNCLNLETEFALTIDEDRQLVNTVIHRFSFRPHE